MKETFPIILIEAFFEITMERAKKNTLDANVWTVYVAVF